MKSQTFILASLCLIYSSCNNSTNETAQTQKEVNPISHQDSLNKEKRQIDSLIVRIKNDSLFEIKDVYFDQPKSTLKIAFTGKYGVLKDKNYTTQYFEQTYKTTDFYFIDGISLYAYKKKKHLSNETDYPNPLLSSSKSRDAYQAKSLSEFKEKFCTEIDCTALEDYIKKQMNDPNSYEPVSVNVKLNKDGDIVVYQEFRGKNSFDATVTQRAVAVMTPEGNVIKFTLI